jgi:hypothetical protein
MVRRNVLDTGKGYREMCAKFGTSLVLVVSNVNQDRHNCPMRVNPGDVRLVYRVLRLDPVFTYR